MLNMGEQITILITILAALLTGGFLMIFIESQQVAGSVAERFHFLMRPFLHSFSNYVKFISLFKSCFRFNITNDSGYIKQLKENVDSISKLGGKSIVSGQDYPADHFKAKELDSICNTINDIWYCIDKDRNNFHNHSGFNSHYAQKISEHTKGYLEAISPKYKGMQLTEDVLEKVSGEFYTEIYQPIERILPHYEFWQRKEKEFKTLALATVSITLLTMLLILLFRCHIAMWVFNTLCIVCCGLLVFELYKLIKLENLSKTIMR